MTKSKTKVVKTFNNPKTGLVGIKELQKQLPDVAEEDIKKSLEAVDAYTLHKPVRRNIERRRVIVNGIDEQWAADLADLLRLVKDNDGFRYLLTVIDIFSKQAWAVPLKNKDAKTVASAFEKIFTTSKRTPLKLQTDDGKEFFNKDVQSLFNKYNIHHFSTPSELKAVVVERFNRTLKERMYKYFETTQSFRYLDELQTLLDNYNNTYHSSIKMKPNDVTPENEGQVFQNLYGDDDTSDKKPKYMVGDYVRISNAKHVFGKSYEGNWSIEVFKITEVQDTKPITYKIEDLMGEEIIGSFYTEELQKVQKPKEFRIESVLRRRTKNGKKEVLVK
eukprot:Lithocolla_globosa_v1_NODE_99_length_6376_cov_39.997943.p1 type:complete len:333 gc:universal NODE_99_length_6376_cov_39.997943:3284-2286(-)